MTTGSDPTAAGGGNREGSEWQRSAGDEGVRAEDIRRAPQQEHPKVEEIVMDTIKFNDGRKSYKVGGGVLRFNPADPALYSRFLEAAQALQQLQPKDFTEADAAVRAQLQKVFPDAALGDIFPGNLLAMCGNGKLLIENFLEAMEPILLAGARSYAR